MLRRTFALSVVALASSLAAMDGNAAAQRTFVASTGNDANPCSVAEPCRGFATAVAAVTPGGEVIVLDSAGYGTFSINKAVSVVAPDGVYAGISVSGAGKGIDVAMGASDTVRLRGLTITSQSGQTATGIYFFAPGTLHIENVRIEGMAAAIAIGGTRASIHDSSLFNNYVGISATSSYVAADVTIERTTIAQSNYAAIAASGVVDITIDHALLANSSHVSTGVLIVTPPPDVGPARAHISNSTIRGFSQGVNGQVTGTSPIILSIGGSEITQNWSAIRMQGGGEVALHGNRLVHNTLVFETTAGTTILTSGNNYITDYSALQVGGGTFATPGGSY